MIINYDSPGQLCNRIWSQLPSIAYGLQYNEKVLLINLDEYSSDFENLNINKLVSFKSCPFLKRIFLSLKARGYIQNGRPNIFSKFFGLNLVEGWSNRLGNAQMVEDQADKIRSIYTFRKEIVSAVTSEINTLKDCCLVGVHIRRGDYMTWLDGMYYYTDQQYLQIMQNIEFQLIEKGRRVKFLICSNEQIDTDNFRPLDCFKILNSSGAKDLFALSQCDYILGPPSSYSQWASFVGQVPVGYIMSANSKLVLSDFSDIVSFNCFRNGSVLNID